MLDGRDTAAVEETCVIDIPDSERRIYGRVRGGRSSPGVVIAHGVLVHAMGCSVTDVHVLNGARALEAAGFSALQFNFYGAEKDARNMAECTIDTHIDDLDLAVQWMSDLDDVDELKG
jgi:hypothetical protein